MNLSQVMTAQDHVFNNHIVAQAKQGVGPQPNTSTPTTRILDYMRMNPSTFHGTKVDENQHGSIDDFFKVVDSMDVIPREEAELAAY